MKSLKYYFISEKGTLHWLKENTSKIDDEGLIMYKLPYTQRFVYYPVNMALYALGNFEMFLDTHDKKYLEIFLKHADWFVENISIKDDFGVWEHDYVLPYYNFNRVPWAHGMAQGLIISVLLRAYQIKKIHKYLDTALLALNAFEKDIEKGGVRFIDKEGNIWYEEYAILPPPHILNGFIFALFGIYEFYQVTESKNALRLFDNGISTLEKKLPLYDLGYWSLYNLLHKYPAERHYHLLHVKQLKTLYRITHKRIFQEYANRWEEYAHKRINERRAYFRRFFVHLRRHKTKIFNIYMARKRWMSDAK